MVEFGHRRDVHLGILYFGPGRLGNHSTWEHLAQVPIPPGNRFLPGNCRNNLTWDLVTWSPLTCNPAPPRGTSHLVPSSTLEPVSPGNQFHLGTAFTWEPIPPGKPRKLVTCHRETRHLATRQLFPLSTPRPPAGSVVTALAPRCQLGSH